MQEEIKIKTVAAQQIAVPTKKTLYCVIGFYSSGILYPRIFESMPDAEKAAFEIRNGYIKKVSIYKFEVDIPNLNE